MSAWQGGGQGTRQDTLGPAEHCALRSSRLGACSAQGSCYLLPPPPSLTPFPTIPVSGTSLQEDKSRVEEEVRRVIDWVEHNPIAEKAEYEAKQRELEAICTPIITRMYEGGGGGGGASAHVRATAGGDMPGAGGAGGPTVEEVD